MVIVLALFDVSNLSIIIETLFRKVGFIEKVFSVSSEIVGDVFRKNK